MVNCGAADVVGVSARMVQYAKAIMNADPEAFERIKAGEMTITQATREIKKKEIAKTVDWPEGKYRVIYADPPWSYGNLSHAFVIPVVAEIVVKFFQMGIFHI
jgi:16S rRNA G966 N2-methylase RsmD